MYKRFKKQHLVLVFISVVCMAVLTGATVATKVLATQSETYEKLKIFSEVLYLIQTNYYKDVDIQEVIYGGIQGMLKTLDPHSSFMSPDDYQEMQVGTQGHFGGLGIQIGIKDDQLTVIAPIDDTPAYRAGIQSGDKIIKIENTVTKDMSLNDAVKLLRGPKGTKVTITIMREGFDKPKEFVLVRDIIQLKSVSFKMLPGKIGYLRLSQFQEDSSQEIENALRDLEADGIEALILDLRNNPGGLLNSAVDIADKFLDKGKLIVYTEGRKKNQDMRFVAHQDFTHPNYPMAILVNHGSASASEIVAGALKAHSRAVIIGTQTYGKGSVQSVIPLSDNSGLRLTTALYYTPDGVSIHEKGITPDVVVVLEPAPQKSDKPETQVQVNQENVDKEEPPKETPSEGGEINEPPVNGGSQEQQTEDKNIEELMKRDSQLMRAIDVLKGILVYTKQISSK